MGSRPVRREYLDGLTGVDLEKLMINRVDNKDWNENEQQDYEFLLKSNSTPILKIKFKSTYFQPNNGEVLFQKPNGNGFVAHTYSYLKTTLTDPKFPEYRKSYLQNLLI